MNQYLDIKNKLLYFLNIEMDENNLVDVNSINNQINDYIKSSSPSAEQLLEISKIIKMIIEKLDLQKTTLSKKISSSTHSKNAYKYYISNSLVLNGNSSTD